MDESSLAEQYADGDNLSTRGSFNARFATTDRHPHDWAFDHVDLSPGVDVLELGCGTGEFWQINGDRLPRNLSLTLTDASPGMVREARKNLESLQAASVEFAAAEASRIPVSSDTVDVVVANQMLYHVPDRSSAYREIRRVLRPGGAVYATTKSADSKRALFEMMDAVADGPVETLNQEFTLEDGGEELREQFGRVESHRFETDLAVTDADALVEYALTLPDADPISAFDADDADDLKGLAERRLSDGPIRMCNDYGLLVAHG